MRLRSSLLLASLAALFATACSRDSGPTGPAPISTEARVFIDNFIAADFQAFSGSKLDAVAIDNTVKYRGTSSLRVTVPVPTDPSGSFAGGAFVATESRNLAGYNAITFWARASRAATLNVAGLGNDNTGTSSYIAERNNIALTTAWAKYTVIIPLASRLSLEKGLFYFAEGAEGGVGYDFWIDDLRFENLPDITNIRPALAPVATAVAIGGTYQIGGLTVTAAVGGVDQTVTAAPGYFAFTSSTPATGTVSSAGLVSVLAAGSTNITATLGGAAVTGAVAITAVAPPSVAAPTPTYPAIDVISLFSNAYTNRTVNTWSASWDQADVADVQIAGNDTKRYTNLTFAGIEFVAANKIDATLMTHFRMDIWTPDASAAPAAFKVKLVDFGADGAFAGGDDREHVLSFEATTTPALTTGAWITLDIPLSQFTGLTTRANMSQIVLEGIDPINTVYVDNVLFYKSAAPPPVTAPTTAAPTPTYLAADVISLFSNAYTNRTVDTWSAVWDQADVSDVQIAGNDTKRYTNLTFAGIEFVGANKIDATTMTHFRMDIWTPDASAVPAAFKVKLVDFGADGAFAGGDDREHQLSFEATSTPALTTGAWITLEIPLAQFTGLTTRANMSQMVLDGLDPINTVFVDNVLFYKTAAPPVTAPTTAAPTPTYAAGDVISLFSNAYTNRTVDTWSAVWDQADVSDVQIAGNDTKRYANLTFAGIEFVGANKIDATTMTHFRMDIWTPDASAVPAAFKVKLVDFGANGAFGGGDDREHQLSFEATSTPALTTGAWITLEIPLAQFTGLTTRANMSQMVLDGLDPINTVFVDNVLFYRTAAPPPTVPVTAAPTPTYLAADVISLFSNAYTNRTVDTWSAVWDQADVADVQIEGNDTKRYTNLTFAGIEFVGANKINATTMTHFRVDIWTPDASAVPAAFKVKLVDFGADGAFGGGDDREHQLSFEATTTPALTTGAWITLDIPLSQFTGLTTRANMSQLILDGLDPINTVFVDNVLFHK